MGVAVAVAVESAGADTPAGAGAGASPPRARDSPRFGLAIMTMHLTDDCCPAGDSWSVNLFLRHRILIPLFLGLR